MPNTVLPYTGEAFCKYYSEECIAIFEPGPYAKGATDQARAKEIVSELNKVALIDKGVIFFDPNMIHGSQLEGGSCSALALQIAKELYEEIGQLTQHGELKKSAKSRALTNKVGRSVQDLVLTGRMNSKEAAEKKRQTRTIQQAFNCINVANAARQLYKNSPERCDKIVGAKMHALAAYFGLAVEDSTPETAVKGNEGLAMHIAELRQSLCNGVYLLRLLEKTYNHKLEVCGHTIVYCKAFGSELYFDPALGYYNLFQGSAKTCAIYQSIVSAQERFTVDSMSMHRLTKRMVQLSPSESVIKLEKVSYSLLPLMQRQLDTIATAMDEAQLLQKEGKTEEAQKIREEAICGIVGCEANAEMMFISPPLDNAQFAIGVRRYLITDESRDRMLEIDIHFPAHPGADPAFKMLAALSDGKIVATPALTRASHNLMPCKDAAYPLILFSPGLGASPDDYHHLFEHCVAAGYCVVSINHPGSTLFMYQNGTAQKPLPRMDEKAIIAEGLQRGADIAFLAKSVSRGKLSHLSDAVGPSIVSQDIITMGHSLGGSAAFEACRLTHVITRTIDLDGRIIYNEDSKPLSQPALLLSAAKEKVNRDKYEEAYQKLKSENSHAKRITIEASHGDFSLASAYRIKGIKGMSERQQSVFKNSLQAITTFLNDTKDALSDRYV